MAKRLAIDIGGTFTDLVALDEETGAVLLEKDHTTPENFARGVIKTIEKSGLDPGEISQFVHGTTVVINAITERKGAKTALITTKGFRDVLEIQRANRPDMYNLFYRKPKPFVPRRYRFEVTERLNYKGEVLQELDEEEVREAISRCKEEGIESIAVCFIHSYANPAHERRVRELIEELYPEAQVTLSHEIIQEWREYERTNTAVLNAYVKPATARYLRLLGDDLQRLGLTAVKYAMQSNGGTTTFAQAQAVPIHLVESGPIGGVIGAIMIGRAVNEENIIAFDMGGTTAKVSLIERGRLQIKTDYHIEKTATFAGYPVKIPVVDIVEVGAGGGSIGWIDKGGALNVGPQSAGADPGPACYGRGGTEPTVTDANLLAGRLNPDYFLGGEVKLEVKQANAAMEKIARYFGIDTVRAAHGIIRVANANMRGALERVSIERGYDPRDFTMIAYGGAGGLHAPLLARELNLKKVIIPRAPGQFSAWGMLMTDLRHDFIRTQVIACNEASLERMNRIFAEMSREALKQFAAEGVSPEAIILERLMDMRYRGQEHTVRTPVNVERLTATDLAVVQERFHNLHDQAYSFRLADPIEVVNFHLVAWGRVEKPELKKLSSDGRELARAYKGEREVDFDEQGVLPSKIYERDRLPAGAEIPGPAVIEEPACTTLIYPGQRLRVDEYGNLVITEVE
ncbi:MAG: hydantoinase/oxoprolinase family protein [Candidatus Bipolaricaulia bacterium]